MNTINEQRQTPDSTTPQEGDEMRGRLIALRRDPAIRRESATQILGNNPFTRISLEHNALLNRQLHALRRSARSAAAQTEALGDSASAMSGWNQTALLQLDTARRQETATTALNGLLTSQLAQHREDIDTAKALAKETAKATQALLAAQDTLVQSVREVANRQVEILSSIDTKLDKVVHGPEQPAALELNIDAEQFRAMAQIGEFMSHFDSDEGWTATDIRGALVKTENLQVDTHAALKADRFKLAKERFEKAIDILGRARNQVKVHPHLENARNLLAQSMISVATSTDATGRVVAQKAEKTRR